MLKEWLINYFFVLLNLKMYNGEIKNTNGYLKKQIINENFKCVNSS